MLMWPCSELDWGTDHVKINSAFPFFLLALPHNKKRKMGREMLIFNQVSILVMFAVGLCEWLVLTQGKDM